MKVLCLLALGQTMALGASHRATAAELVDLVFTSLYSDHEDGRLAQELNRLQMAEQLSPRISMYFHSLGLGPQAFAALQKLQNQSALLPLPAEPALSIQPVPTVEQQQSLRQRLFEYARSYVQHLPDFLCDQATHRYTNWKGTRADGMPRYGAKLDHSDHFTRSLRFSGGVEHSSAVQSSRSIEGNTTRKSGQSITSGEFGGDLLILFGADANPQFDWDHWEGRKGERKAVFHYFVSASHSQYTLLYCCFYPSGFAGKRQQRYNPSLRGLISFDPSTGVMARLMMQAVDLPPTLRIRESNTIIDYDVVMISGRSYILPVKALVFSRTEDGQKNRNEITFTRYRKFEAESVLTFNSPASDKAVANQ
jgi:hypothetical protein